jgi:hypothetical protein
MIEEIKIVGEGPYSINPSNTKRLWMDETQNSHAYRCLPMTAVNSHGWTINLEEECVVEWDGTDQQGSVKVISGPGEENVAGGFVTFRFPYIFSTSENFYLWCSGQPNYTRDDMFPLNAIIRTDWYPATFQFTWKLTRPGKIIFEVGMPVMFFMPYPKNLIDNVSLAMYDVEPSRSEAHKAKMYGLHVMSYEKRIRNSENSWKEWVGLYRKGKYSEKEPNLVDDAMWVPRPQKPKKMER